MTSNTLDSLLLEGKNVFVVYMIPCSNCPQNLEDAAILECPEKNVHRPPVRV